MATTNKGLNVPGIGSTGWGDLLNANTNILDSALGSAVTIGTPAGVYDLLTSDVQSMCLKSISSPFDGNVTYRIPIGIKGQWVVQNLSGTSTYTLTVSSAGGGTSVTVPRGSVRSVYCDGTNVVYADTPASGDFTNVTVSGTLGVSGITTLSSSLVIGGDSLTKVATLDQAKATNPINTVIMTPLRTKDSITFNAPLTMAALARGAVGTYAFMGTNSKTVIDGGETTPGSNLRYASLWRDGNVYSIWAVIDFGGAPSPPGVWRLMGDDFISTRDSQTSLFLRIS